MKCASTEKDGDGSNQDCQFTMCGFKGTMFKNCSLQCEGNLGSEGNVGFRKELNKRIGHFSH